MNSSMNSEEGLELIAMRSNLSDNVSCLWEDNVTRDSSNTCLDFLAEEEKDYLYKVSLVQFCSVSIFKCFWVKTIRIVK